MVPSARRGIHCTRKLAWLALTWTSSSCTLIMDVGQAQCESSADCIAAGLGLKCVEQICSGPCSGNICEGDEHTQADGEPATSCDLECSAATRCFGGVCVASDLVDALICAQEQPAGPAPKDIRMTLAVRELVSGQPPTDLKIAVCRNGDVSCEQPSSTFEDSAGDGEATLVLPRPFDGFLQVESDDLIQAIWYSSEPLESDRSKVLRVPRREDYAQLSTSAGYVARPNRGMVVLEAQDCAGQALEGVRFTDSTRSGEPYVFIDHAPNGDVPLTVLDAELNTAWGGFINAEPGFSVFSAYLGLDGPLLSEFNAWVRADWLTYVDFTRPPGQAEAGAE